jgi:hypothetical protein
MRLAAACVGHDADWQYPAITEQHAFLQAAKLLPESPALVYCAFPWATLIDRLNTLGKKASASILDALDDMAKEAAPYPRRITVCQHIKGMQYKELFVRAGITDVFWSHATNATDPAAAAAGFDLHPFPLYPVQAPDDASVSRNAERQHLFSFVGARSNQWYLTQSRNDVIELMGLDPRGLVRARDQWHFNKIVYDHQIRGKAADAQTLVDEAASIEFRRTLEQSVFSICPSGTGPNSIRLWEAMGFGSIPVILADTYLPPGDPALWQQAAVFCEESAEAISKLAGQLADLAKDEVLLEHKRQGLRQLWMLYGPDFFIHDVVHLYFSVHFRHRLAQAPKYSLSSERLLQMAKELLIRAEPDGAMANHYLRACSSRVLLNSQQLQAEIYAYPELDAAIGEAFGRGAAVARRMFSDVLKLKRVKVTSLELNLL